MNLIDRIDNYLIKKEYHKRDAYYPSEVNKCIRQLYYRWTEEPESNPVSAGALWKMRIGDAIHDMIHEYLKSSGMEIVPEVSFKKNIGLDYPISGRIDDLFIDEDGELSGIEAKTSFGRGIVSIQRDGNPREDDLNQVIIYMSCNPSIKRFYIVYFGRDNAYRTQFIINRYDNLEHDFNNLIQKFYTLKDFINLKILPDRQYIVAIKNGEIKDKFQKNKIEYKSDWQCRYCAFQNKCWKEEIVKYYTSDNSLMFPETAQEAPGEAQNEK
jgi:hypothetical protein